VFFTFTQVSQYSLVALLSADGREQALLGNLLSIFSTVGSLCTSLFFVKLLPVFSSDPNNPETQSGYSGSLAVFCIVTAVLILVSVITTQERVGALQTGKGKNGIAGVKSFVQTTKALLGNRYWVFIFAVTIVIFFTVQVDMAGAAYFASYVLGDLGAISWILSSTLISSSLIQFVTPALMGRFGKRSLYLLGLCLCTVGLLGLGMCVPNQTAMLICNVIRGFGTGIISALNAGLVADTIRYTEFKSGVYSAGMGNAGITAARKVGHGIGSAVFGLVLSAAGFSAVNDMQNLAQPQSVLTATTWMYVWVPMLCYAIIFVLFFFFFHLERELKALEGKNGAVSNSQV
jgi:GPH family glycoside/pentoside/hexuronide:cation symporter